LIAIVDITRSMNAEDYELDDKPVSRLTYVKHSLRELLLKMSCGSKLGLGVFTDRRSSLLFEPIDVCSGFNELDTAIAALDWRMAWSADSRIANGLSSTIEMLKDRTAGILFITDGQEAPPVNILYHTDFTAVKGKAEGIIIGTGGLQAVSIPKLNNKGEQIGVYQPDDVPHRSSFGISDLNPERIEGYDARNAPFGSAVIKGHEHLSALNEPYLQDLAAQSGFSYQRLTGHEDIVLAMQQHLTPRQIKTSVDIRWRYVSIALILLSAIWF
jgi:mxaL protein